jgi:excisionase family DNA binding protein
MHDGLQSPGPGFVRAVNEIFQAETDRLQASTFHVDLLFAAYVRYMSRFGYFTYGPITLDANLVEDIAERTVPRRGSGDSGPVIIGDDAQRLSFKVMEEVRRSGRKHIDELHYLLAFMRLDEGLPKRVFSELGVTPEQVETYARSVASQSPQRPMEKLYSPEEAAVYLNIHVQTVRTWIRTGRLRARRLAGQRALRITASDLQSVLEPLDPDDEQIPTTGSTEGE